MPTALKKDQSEELRGLLLRLVEKHYGTQVAAAEALGINQSTISAILSKGARVGPKTWEALLRKHRDEVWAILTGTARGKTVPIQMQPEARAACLERVESVEVDASNPCITRAEALCMARVLGLRDDAISAVRRLRVPSEEHDLRWWFELARCEDERLRLSGK